MKKRLGMHEAESVNSYTDRYRVPGGWIYVSCGTLGMTSTFVPKPAAKRKVTVSPGWKLGGAG